MSEVWIQSSAKFIEHLFTVNCIEKTKLKKKEAGNGPFKKFNKSFICPFAITIGGTALGKQNKLLPMSDLSLLSMV